MRKSGQKTPSAELGSGAVRLPAGLLVVAGRRHDGSATGRAAALATVADARHELTLGERLHLLEGLLSRTEIADCARYALQWLGETLGVTETLCLVQPAGTSSLVTIASSGVKSPVDPPFAVSLDDWSHPLVNVLNTRRAVRFAAHAAADRRRRPATPFGDAPFHVLPLETPDLKERAAGLLLLGRVEKVSPELTWFVSVLSRTLDRMLRQQAPSDGDRQRIATQNELLRRQAVELEQASALKAQFLANVSHEFRTPLNAMLGYTSMLLQGVAGPLDPAQKRQLGRIESNGRHLLTIIDEILDISRIEAGRMPLQMSTFQLGDLAAEVRAELEPVILRSKLIVEIALPEDLPPLVSDRRRMKQILVNLLSNALKFTHRGGVTISARQLRRERLIAIAVADTGIGIALADQKWIFEDFRQIDNSPTRAYGGTGLGLSICRRLAGMLGGRIAVDSVVGAGSTFTLTVPIQGRR